MLGGAIQNGSCGEVFHSAGPNKRVWRKWVRGVVDSVVEPTSVLDIRSPSPSSTLSSSIAAASSENGAAVDLLCEEGQLPDCTSLLEVSNEEEITIWGVDGEEDGKAEKAMVGTFQSGENNAWEQNLVHANVEEGEAPRGYGEGPHGLIMAGVVAAGMSSVGGAPGFRQFFSSTCTDDHKMMVRSEVMVADESLEACVMSCRKRDRQENSLEEVVLQRFGHGHGRKLGSAGDGGQKLEQGELLSDWNNIYSNAAALVEEKHNLEDLVDIFGSSAAPAPSLVRQLPSSANVGHGNLQSAAKVQLDLYEAVQAGMIGRRASNVGVSGGEAPPMGSPAPPRNDGCSSARLSSPLQQLGGSCGAALLNATYPLPPFSAQLQLQGRRGFSLPSIKHSQQQGAQAQLYGHQKPEYGSSKVNCVEPKLWQMSADVSPKVILPAGGPKCLPIEQEPAGWQQLIGSGHVSTPLLSQPFRTVPPAEQPAQRRHPLVLAGRRGRLEELSLAERQFTAVAEAARLGDIRSAQAMLARLNHQQHSKGQQQTPSHRVTSLFAQALAQWVSACPSSSPSHFQQTPHEPSSMDLIDKISAYKSFCEVSPISQFAHFTANQTILEAMEGEDRIHLIDFELGLGGQWASFMQEIFQRRSAGPPELKITTMGCDTLEMRLAKDILFQFAQEMGMKLQIDVLPVQKMEGIKAAMVKKGNKEAVAVNFGFGLSRLMADFSCAEEGVVSLLEVIKGLNPKVIAVVDSECEFEGTSLMEALQFYESIFDAMEAAGKLSREVRERIEKMVFGPKIRDVVNARCGQGTKNGAGGLPPWRILMQKAGFSALSFSAAAENQASWLVRNPLNSGFSFVKQQSTLFLGWCNRNLVSASAWV